MVTFIALTLLTPVLILAILLFGAWREGRRSPYSFGIGRVLSNAFVAIGGAPLAFVAVAVLLSAIPGAFVTSSVATATNGIGQSPQAVETMVARWGNVYSGIGLVQLLLWPLSQLLLTLVALDTLGRRPVDIRAAAYRALRLWPFAIGLMILSWIGIFIGFMLLVVPGVILLLNWFVVLPVLAAEHGGLLASFGRSTQLLRGMRWRLALLLLVAVVLWYAVAIVINLIQVAIVGQTSWLLVVTGFVSSTLTGMIVPAGVAAVYHEARVAKEGTAGDLADVFA